MDSSGGGVKHDRAGLDERFHSSAVCGCSTGRGTARLLFVATATNDHDDDDDDDVQSASRGKSVANRGKRFLCSPSTWKISWRASSGKIQRFLFASIIQFFPLSPWLISLSVA